jgi:hypothetical protein
LSPAAATPTKAAAALVVTAREKVIVVEPEGVAI